MHNHEKKTILVNLEKLNISNNNLNIELNQVKSQLVFYYYIQNKCTYDNCNLLSKIKLLEDTNKELKENNNIKDKIIFDLRTSMYK